MTRVAIDGMGGDLAPAATTEGAIAVAREGIEVALVGDEQRLAAEIERLGGAPAGLRVVHAPDVIEMGDHAAREAIRRKESSTYVGVALVRDGEADAFVSAGNTGAVFVVALLELGRLPGVERPAIGAPIPFPNGLTLLLDAGANAECRASHLVQFAHLGSSYMRAARGVAEPRVGLLNIGEEGSKGSPLTIETHERLSESGLRFIGNIEGREMVENRADVVVTDGFTGNVVLKLGEGLMELLMGELRSAAERSWRGRLGGLLIRPAARRVRDSLDYRAHGAAPLLGLDGSVFIAHGTSDAFAIANALRSAAADVERGTLAALRGAMAAAEGAGE